MLPETFLLLLACNVCHSDRLLTPPTSTDMWNTWFHGRQIVRMFQYRMSKNVLPCISWINYTAFNLFYLSWQILMPFFSSCNNLLFTSKDTGINNWFISCDIFISSGKLIRTFLYLMSIEVLDIYIELYIHSIYEILHYENESGQKLRKVIEMWIKYVIDLKQVELICVSVQKLLVCVYKRFEILFERGFAQQINTATSKALNRMES